MALIYPQQPSATPLMSYVNYDEEDRNENNTSSVILEDDSDGSDSDRSDSDEEGYDYEFQSLADSNIVYSMEDMKDMDKEKRESIIDYISAENPEMREELVQFLEGQLTNHIFNSEPIEIHRVSNLLTQFKRIFEIE